MIQFVGRSFYTIAIPGKPILLDHKVWAFAEKGYTFVFIFTLLHALSFSHTKTQYPILLI